jgi:hypothetical protein
MLATSSRNWHFRLQFSYPSLIILKLEEVSMSKGTTGIITYLLLKNKFGREAVPFKMTSTYFNGSANFEEVMKRGNLWKY